MSQPKLLFVPIGGLGASQFRTTGWFWKKVGLIDVVKKIPDVLVFENSGRDEFKGDGVWDFVLAYPGVPVFVVGHSLGVDTAIHMMLNLYYCAGGALFSPVWTKKPNPGVEVSVFKPTSSCFPQADVDRVNPSVIPGTDHNSICHDEGVMAKVVADLSKILAIE